MWVFQRAIIWCMGGLSNFQQGRRRFDLARLESICVTPIWQEYIVQWSAHQLWGRQLRWVCWHEVVRCKEWLSNFQQGRRIFDHTRLESISIPVTMTLDSANEDNLYLPMEEDNPKTTRKFKPRLQISNPFVPVRPTLRCRIPVNGITLDFAIA